MRCVRVFPVLHNTRYTGIGYIKGEGQSEADILKTMKKIGVFLVAFCWCLCEAQVPENDGKVHLYSDMLSCCGSISLFQNLGTMGEKLTNMAEKITALEDKLQQTEKTVMELRSIIGGEQT